MKQKVIALFTVVFAVCAAFAQDYDVLVAGGGPAGIGAAYTAAKRGAKVLLLEKNGRLGGAAIQAHVGPLLGGVKSPITQTICSRLYKGGVDFQKLDLLAWDLLQEAGAEVLLHSYVLEPLMEGKRVTGLKVQCREGPRNITAKVVIDATGDGVVAAAAGVPFEIGRKEDGLTQPMSIMFTIDGIAPGKRVGCGSEEAARQFKIQGKSWETIVQEEIAAGALPPEVGVIRLYGATVPTMNIVNATQVNKLNGTKSADLTKAEITCRKQAFQVLDVVRRHLAGYEKAYISGMPAVIGVRETRRFEGVARLEKADCLAGRKRDDAIVHSANFCIDIHNPAGAGQAAQQETFVTGEAERVRPYDIPYGALVPKEVDGLLLSGRCISAAHEALASCRVMRIAMATGVGAGAAAAYAVQNNIELRDVPPQKLKLLEENGK